VKPAPFDYMAARSVGEAVEALARHGEDAKVLAGGQSLLPMLNMRLARPAVVVDVNGVSELDYVRQTDGTLAVGAVCRQRVVERWAAQRAPLLAAVLRAVGHVAIRTRGTVGGSVAHADPASELPALLLALDGEVTARSARGERTIAAGELFVAPLTTSLAEGELLTEARFRFPGPGTGWGFAEVTRRHGDFALVGAVSLLGLGADARVTTVRLAFFGVGGTPVRGAAAEGALVGQEPTRARIEEAARTAAAALSPEADLHATAAYRRRVAEVLAVRTLTEALERARAGTAAGARGTR
jgi:carbon-monoxide dehydrogenase medium subunit